VSISVKQALGDSRRRREQTIRLPKRRLDRREGVSCSSQGIIPLSALHLLPAVLRQLAHYAPALDDRTGMPTVIEARRNSYLLKNSLNSSPPAYRRGQTVALRIVFEKNRRERLRCRPANTSRPRGSYWLCSEQQWITWANLFRRTFVAVADEADLAVG